MEITRELLTGNIHLTLEVYATPGEADHPARFQVIITPQRAAQIRQMAAIIRKGKDHGLDLWSLRAWDYSGDWLAWVEDDDGNEIEGAPERMECCAIVVSADDCYFEAAVKHCDIHCEAALIALKDLSEAVSAPKLEPRYGCPRGHTEGITASYTIDIEMPADLTDPDETTNADLGECQTDNWQFRHYWCPQCNETCDQLVELDSRYTTAGGKRDEGWRTVD
jgi:hypothetical protein